MSNFKSLGEKLRKLREQRALFLREVAANLQIDPSLLSKIERGDKRPTRDQIVQLSNMYSIDQADLIITFLSEKICTQLKDEEFAMEALQEAKELLENKKSRN